MKYSDDEKTTHLLLMKTILKEIGDKNLPLYLKGGTALLLHYGLDRFSEDIDLNSEKKLNLESIIKKAIAIAKVDFVSLNLVKDTNTTKRYILSYNKDKKLKLETSYRSVIKDDEWILKNNCRVYKLKELAKMKIEAVYGQKPRIKARDLHDIAFIATQYLNELDDETRVGFQRLSQDTELLFNFKADYDLDPLLIGRFFEDVSKLEKAFVCCGVDIEKEFPKELTLKDIIKSGEEQTKSLDLI